MSISANGQNREVDVPEDMPLLWILRDELKITGVKYGCGIARCGACTVHIDGRAMRSVAGAVVRFVGVQGTGGSSCEPDSFDKLRMAGAFARETLKLAATPKSGVPVDQMKTANDSDPLEQRLRLTNDDVSRKVLEEIGDMSKWGSPIGENQGRGIAFVHSFGVPTAEVVEVTNTSAGIRLDKAYVVADVDKVIDPIKFDIMMKGGLIWGLGHRMNINVVESRIDAEFVQCSTCNAFRENGINDVPNAAPQVALNWQLAPLEAEWFRKISAEVCARLSNLESNGDRKILEIAEHHDHDFILHWAWNLGGGREPAPYSLQEHVNDVFLQVCRAQAHDRVAKHTRCQPT